MLYKLSTVIQCFTVLYSDGEVFLECKLYSIMLSFTYLYSGEEVLMWCDDPDLLAWEVRTGWGKLLRGISEKYANK